MQRIHLAQSAATVAVVFCSAITCSLVAAQDLQGYGAATTFGYQVVPGSAKNDPVSGAQLHNFAYKKNYRAQRKSSESRNANNDYLPISAGETTTIAHLVGPGEVTHIWVTIATGDEQHMRNIVMRAYYDGNDFPSIESPIGDFFGLGHAKAYVFNNPVQAIGTDRGMNCFWPMPFAKGVRFEITNESPTPIGAFYYYVDWRKTGAWDSNLNYFHAQYLQAMPAPDKQNYLILDTEGASGHFMGCNVSIHTQVDGWWGEGDDIFTIDGEAVPSLWGTGSEDYFCGAWGFGAVFYNDYFGMPLRTKPDHSKDNYWNVYRLHLESPVPFTKSLKVEIEHGAQGFDNSRNGGRNNDYSSVAYWYADKPLPLKGKLPPAPQRLPGLRKVAAPEGVLLPTNMELKLPEGVACDPQDMGGFQKEGRTWLHGDQLFCNKVKQGDAVELTFETTAPMSGESVLKMTKAPDYGVVTVELDGTALAENVDLYAPEVQPTTISIKEQSLPPGKHTLRIKVTDKDAQSSNTLWGLDYLRIGGKKLE